MNRVSSSSGVVEALFFATVVFGPLAFGSTETWSLAIHEFLVFTLMFICCWNNHPIPDGVASRTLLPAVVIVLVLGAMQAVSYQNPSLPSSLVPFTVSSHATYRALLLWAAYASFLWCAHIILSRTGAIERLTWCLFLLGILISTVGIVQRGQGNSAYYGLRPVVHGLPFGPYANYNHAASLMVMSGFCGTGLIAHRFLELWRMRSSGDHWNTAAKLGLLLFLIGVIVAGILVTGSRGALNAMAVSVILVGVLALKRVSKNGFIFTSIGAGLALAVVGYGLIVIRHPGVIGSVFSRPDVSTSLRLSMYKSGLTALFDFPIWGLGLGGVARAFSPYQELWHHRFVVDHVHNDWLELALQSGAVVFFAVSAVFAAFFVRVLRVWKDEKSSHLWFLMAGSLAAAVSFLIHSFVDFSWQIPANAFCFLAVLSLLSSLAGLGAGGSASRVLPQPARVALCLGALFLGFVSLRVLAGDVYRAKAEGAPAAMRSYYLDRASRLDSDPRYRYQLAVASLENENSSSESERIRLIESFRSSTALLSLDPLNPSYRRLQAAILWRLGRHRDALDISK